MCLHVSGTGRSRSTRQRCSFAIEFLNVVALPMVPSVLSKDMVQFESILGLSVSTWVNGLTA